MNITVSQNKLNQAHMSDARALFTSDAVTRRAAGSTHTALDARRAALHLVLLALSVVFDFVSLPVFLVIAPSPVKP